MLDLDRARAAIHREIGQALVELEAVDDDAWSRPTRCDGWAVRDLVAHLVWGQNLEAQAVEAVAEGRTTADEVAAVAPSSEPADLHAALERASARLGDALVQRTTADLGTAAPMPYGPVPLGLLLQVIAMEVGVHHSDLRAALDLPAELAADVVEATAAFLAAFLPAVASTHPAPSEPVAYRFHGAVVDLTLRYDGAAWVVDGDGQEATVTFTGDDGDLCLLATGRLPPDDARIAVTGDLAAARRFRDYVPGL